MCFPHPGSDPRPGGQCPAEFPSISFPRLGFLSVYGYFGLNSPDSCPLPAPPAQMLFLQASPGHFRPRGVLARLAGGAGGPRGLSVARASWAQHVLWAQAPRGLSQPAVGTQLPWKNTDSLLSRKGLATMGRRLQLTVLGDQGLGKGFGGPLVASPLPSLALWSAVWKSDTVLKPAVAVGLRKPAPLFSACCPFPGCLTSNG